MRGVGLSAELSLQLVRKAERKAQVVHIDQAHVQYMVIVWCQRLSAPSPFLVWPSCPSDSDNSEHREQRLEGCNEQNVQIIQSGRGALRKDLEKCGEEIRREAKRAVTRKNQNGEWEGQIWYVNAIKGRCASKGSS